MIQPEKVQAYLTQISTPNLPVEDALKCSIFNCSLWLLGIPAFTYGAVERGLVTFGSSAASVVDVSRFMVAVVALLGWLFIGMDEFYCKSQPARPSAHSSAWPRPNSLSESDYVTQQTYRLPFPYTCQIFHLLNLKHLEQVHRFSLGNLKVLGVSHFQKTQTGGKIRFNTTLDSTRASGANASTPSILRIWRARNVEVDLTLHTLSQIELSVPLYNQRYIKVLFSVRPLGKAEHLLNIQLFSNLRWPRHLLRAVLLLASSLTLLEDIPYLAHLASCKDDPLSHSGDSKASPQTMQLFHRYVGLYNRHLSPSA